MALEVCKGDEDISIHNGSTDLSILYILSAINRHFDIIVTFEAVSKALGEGRRITTLAQAKEALAR